MADNKSKGAGKLAKTSEMVLGLLGTLGSIAGPLITGENVDLGLPFKLGSAYLNTENQKNDLLAALNSNPHTAGFGEEVQGAIEAGGLPALLGSMGQPQVSQPPSLSAGTPSVAIPEALPPMDPAQAPVQAPVEQVPLNVDSDEFLRILADKRPDLAEKVLLQRTATKPASPIDSIVESLKLQDLMNKVSSFQTPAQQREAELVQFSNKSDISLGRQQTMLAERDRVARQKELDMPKKPFVDAMDTHDKAVGLLSSMLDTVNTGGMPSFIAKLASGDELSSGFAQWAGLASPRDIQMSRDINQLVMAVVKQQSGVQYGFRELQWVKTTQPSKWDTEETFRNGISMAMNNALFNKYNMIISRAQRAGNIDVALREQVPGGDKMSLEQVKAYQILTKQLGERAQKGVSDARIFADPKNQRLLEELGMVMLDKPTKY